MKRFWIGLLISAMIFSLMACGASAPAAPAASEAPAETQAAAAAEAADETYEAVPYNLYPAPEGGYVGDTMPFVVDGRLELYYLYDTDHNGQGYHPFYKYSTDNFYEYKDHGKVLDFGLMNDPDPALGTGGVMQTPDGLYHLFYTGHNDTLGNAGRDRECVMHAVSEDRENWTKIPEDTFYAPENYSKDDFRDPNVFWVEEDQCYWMLIGARENTQGGVVAKFTSTDLKNWKVCEPLYAPHNLFMLECPDLFQMGDKWYLTYSWECVTFYAMADSMNGPFTAPFDNILDGTGFVFYAAKTGLLNGNRYLCGWVGRSGVYEGDSGMYNWAGNMVNHQLVQHEDGTLGVREPESLANYFTADKEVVVRSTEGDAKAENGTYTLNGTDGVALVDFGVRTGTMMMEFDVTFNGGVAGVAVGGIGEYGYSGLCLDANRYQVHYEGIPVDKVDSWDTVSYTRFDFSKSDTHHVKLVCENEIVIVYIDNVKALSTRMYESVKGGHIGLFANGTDAVFTNVTMKIPG